MHTDVAQDNCHVTTVPRRNADATARHSRFSQKAAVCSDAFASDGTRSSLVHRVKWRTWHDNTEQFVHYGARCHDLLGLCHRFRKDADQSSLRASLRGARQKHARREAVCQRRMQDISWCELDAWFFWTSQCWMWCQFPQVQSETCGDWQLRLQNVTVAESLNTELGPGRRDEQQLVQSASGRIGQSSHARGHADISKVQVGMFKKLCCYRSSRVVCTCALVNDSHLECVMKPLDETHEPVTCQ